MATVVEAMRSNYAQHFANPSLSSTVRDKKAEVEAAFGTMQSLLQQLAVFDITLKACTEQAAAAAASTAAPPAGLATSQVSPHPILQAVVPSAGAAPPSGEVNTTVGILALPNPVVDENRTTGTRSVSDNIDDNLIVRIRAVRTKRMKTTHESQIFEI